MLANNGKSLKLNLGIGYLSIEGKGIQFSNMQDHYYSIKAMTEDPNSRIDALSVNSVVTTYLHLGNKI